MYNYGQLLMIQKRLLLGTNLSLARPKEAVQEAERRRGRMQVQISTDGMEGRARRTVYGPL
jgi:hypothetical protein